MTPEAAIAQFTQIKSERDNWESLWQDAASFVLPRKAYVTSKRVPGQQQDFHRIFDNTAISSLRTMSAGFHSHLTNPSSKWFEMRMQDKKLMDNKDVRMWLQDAEDKIFSTLNNSNFDATMQEFYPDLGCFGTASIFIEEDDVEDVRFTMLPIQQVYLVQDASGRINGFFRAFQLTAQQAWDKWGIAAGIVVMEAMKEEKTKSKMLDFMHWVMPREKRDPSKEDNLSMPYESFWIETTKKHVIKESGFKEFPLATGRFYRQAGQVYADSPTSEVMATTRMINAEKKTLIRAAMKVVDPPQSVPSRGFMMPLNFNPSGINYRDKNVDADSIQPIGTGGNIPIGIEMVQQAKAEIEEGYFVPLFKAFSQITKVMTIPEVQRRITENMVLLGPVVGRLTQDVFDIIIQRLFFMLLRTGKIPPPPSTLEDQEVEVIYISQLAKAQRASEILSLERTLATISGIAEFFPNVLDKIDSDKVVDVVADIHGTDPSIIRDAEEVLKLRADRAELEQQIKEQEIAAQSAQTVKTMSEAENNMAGV